MNINRKSELTILNKLLTPSTLNKVTQKSLFLSLSFSHLASIIIINTHMRFFFSMRRIWSKRVPNNKKKISEIKVAQ